MLAMWSSWPLGRAVPYAILNAQQCFSLKAAARHSTKRPEISTGLPTAPCDTGLVVARDGRLIAQQGGGASAMLSGHRFIMEAINHLLTKGVPLDRFAFSRTNRILVGRPILKALQVKTDFEQDLEESTPRPSLEQVVSSCCSLMKALMRIPCNSHWHLIR